MHFRVPWTPEEWIICTIIRTPISQILLLLTQLMVKFALYNLDLSFILNCFLNLLGECLLESIYLLLPNCDIHIHLPLLLFRCFFNGRNLCFHQFELLLLILQLLYQRFRMQFHLLLNPNMISNIRLKLNNLLLIIIWDHHVPPTRKGCDIGCLWDLWVQWVF